MPEPERDTGEPQITSSVLMVRPAAFTRNEVTRPSNRFQDSRITLDTGQATRAAETEFDALVNELKKNHIDVRVFPGRTMSTLPDEVFPNNWITTHADGTVVLYPMMAWNRRPERRRDIVTDLQQGAASFRIERVIDLSSLENKGQFLEGTGSLVLDRKHRIAYACLSPRTHMEALKEFSRQLEYEVVALEAFDRNGHAIFHTNVFMSLGESFGVVCLESLREIEERFRIINRLERSGREVIELSFKQLHAFAGNMIQLKARRGTVIVLSSRAARSLQQDQIDRLLRHGQLVMSNLTTLETLGGGSARCMLAEIFLPKKSTDRSEEDVSRPD